MWCRKAKEITKWYTNLDDEIYESSEQNFVGATKSNLRSRPFDKLSRTSHCAATNPDPSEATQWWPAQKEHKEKATLRPAQPSRHRKSQKAYEIPALKCKIATRNVAHIQQNSKKGLWCSRRCCVGLGCRRSPFHAHEVNVRVDFQEKRVVSAIMHIQSGRITSIPCA